MTDGYVGHKTQSLFFIFIFFWRKEYLSLTAVGNEDLESVNYQLPQLFASSPIAAVALRAGQGCSGMSSPESQGSTCRPAPYFSAGTGQRYSALMCNLSRRLGCWQAWLIYWVLLSQFVLVLCGSGVLPEFVYVGRIHSLTEQQV